MAIPIQNRGGVIIPGMDQEKVGGLPEIPVVSEGEGVPLDEVKKIIEAGGQVVSAVENAKKTFENGAADAGLSEKSKFSQLPEEFENQPVDLGYMGVPVEMHQDLAKFLLKNEIDINSWNDLPEKEREELMRQFEYERTKEKTEVISADDEKIKRERKENVGDELPEQKEEKSPVEEVKKNPRLHGSSAGMLAYNKEVPGYYSEAEIKEVQEKESKMSQETKEQKVEKDENLPVTDERVEKAIKGELKPDELEALRAGKIVSEKELKMYEWLNNMSGTELKALGVPQNEIEAFFKNKEYGYLLTGVSEGLSEEEINKLALAEKDFRKFYEGKDVSPQTVNGSVDSFLNKIGEFHSMPELSAKVKEAGKNLEQKPEEKAELKPELKKEITEHEKANEVALQNLENQLLAIGWQPEEITALVDNEKYGYLVNEVSGGLIKDKEFYANLDSLVNDFGKGLEGKMSPENVEKSKDSLLELVSKNHRLGEIKSGLEKFRKNEGLQHVYYTETINKAIDKYKAMPEEQVDKEYQDIVAGWEKAFVDKNMDKNQMDSIFKEIKTLSDGKFGVDKIEGDRLKQVAEFKDNILDLYKQKYGEEYMKYYGRYIESLTNSYIVNIGVYSGDATLLQRVEEYEKNKMVEKKESVDQV